MLMAVLIWNSNRANYSNVLEIIRISLGENIKT